MEPAAVRAELKKSQLKDKVGRALMMHLVGELDPATTRRKKVRIARAVPSGEADAGEKEDPDGVEEEKEVCDEVDPDTVGSVSL